MIKFLEKPPVWILVNALCMLRFWLVEAAVVVSRPVAESLNSIDIFNYWFDKELGIILFSTLINVLWLWFLKKHGQSRARNEWILWSTVVVAWVVLINIHPVTRDSLNIVFSIIGWKTGVIAR